MKRPIRYLMQKWLWENEIDSGGDDTRDGAEQEYVESCLKHGITPDWKNLLTVNKEDYDDRKRSRTK
jgi:hypothetical protein